MSLHRDRALVLQRHPYSESSLVVRAFTPRYGRVSLIAKGAYRPTSRYYAVLDLFDTLEMEWDASPRSELATLRKADVATRRRAIRGDLGAYRAATTVLELLDVVLRAGSPETKLFARTERALDDLDGGRRTPDFALASFELALLEELGLAPALERCAACGRSSERAPAHGDRSYVTRVAFSAGAGGRLCTACAREARASARRVGTLPVRVLDAARRVWQDPPGAPEVDEALLVRVRDFVERFLGYHLETRPKSHRAFLSVPNRNAPLRSAPARDASGLPRRRIRG